MPTPAPFNNTPTGKHFIGYHTSWSNYGRNYQVKDLSIDNVSDIAYAFFNVNATQGAFSGDPWADFDNPYIGKGVEPQNTWSSPPSDLGNFGQFNKLRKAGKKFNLQLSIGGWSWSGFFSDAVATDTSRRKLVDTIVETFNKWPGLFNGVSLDWEYLSNDGKNYGLDGNHADPKDADNFIEFLKMLRSALGNGWTISICTSAAPEKIKMPVDKIHPLLDQIHIMTYDFHDGNWGEKVSGHHTNLRKSPHGVYSCEEATAAWLGYGVPSKKLYIGAAFYSRGFGNTDGIGKSCSGGSPDKSWEDGVVDYKALPLSGAVEMWDDEAHAPYSYDSSRRVLNSYDNIRSCKEKCQFVHDNNLGGIIVWETSGDHPYSHEKSLMKVFHDCLTHGKPTDVSPSPPVIPTPPGGEFTPNRDGAIVPSPSPVTPTPSPITPTPSPVTPTPAPVTGTYPCDFCKVCTKTNKDPCVRRDGSTPSPAPAPSPTPAPAPSPSPSPAPAPAPTGSEWKVGVQYKIGDVVTYKGRKFQCRIAHGSMESWAPDLTSALWLAV